MSDHKMPTEPLAPEQEATEAQPEKDGASPREDEAPKPADQPDDPYKTRT